MADNVGNKPPRGFSESLPTGATIAQSKFRLGADYSYPDRVPVANGADTTRSNRSLVMRLVRNTSGISLAPKRYVTWESDSEGLNVDGYCDVTAERLAGVVDEFLPASGAPDDALFLIARKGPAMTLTPLTGNADNVINVGDLMGGLTSVTSQATTSGRAKAVAAVSTHVPATIKNVGGRAMSAKTTANTNADMLVDLDIYA